MHKVGPGHIFCFKSLPK